MSRRELAHWAAPAAFLVALTIAILLVRSGLEGGSPSSAPTTISTSARTATTTAKAKTKRKRPAQPGTTTTATTAAVYYTVQSGDTFGSIAARYGTTVQQLEALNPGASSTSLTIGQKIRVK